jgi:hypothetical protein
MRHQRIDGSYDWTNAVKRLASKRRAGASHAATMRKPKRTEEGHMAEVPAPREGR